MLFYLENIQKVELITEAQADMNPEKTRERFHDLTLLSASERNYPASPAEAKLEAFNNVYADRDYVIEFDCPEYTSLCPVTGQPDFGHIIVRYVPDKKCIESKSLKLYLYSFRNTNTFHEDHLNPVEFVWRRSPWFSIVKKQLTVIGGRRVFGKLMGYIADGLGETRWENLNLRPVEAHPGERLTDGPLELLPLRANHAPGQDPLIYVFTRGGRSVLVANDTGWLDDEMWKLLEGVKLDAAVIESTGGPGHPEWRDGHMGGDTSIAFRKKLVDMGCLAADAPAIVNHFSHNCMANHDDLEKFFNPHGIEVAYDGMILEL